MRADGFVRRLLAEYTLSLATAAVREVVRAELQWPRRVRLFRMCAMCVAWQPCGGFTWIPGRRRNPLRGFDRNVSICKGQTGLKTPNVLSDLNLAATPVPPTRGRRGHHATARRRPVVPTAGCPPGSLWQTRTAARSARQRLDPETAASRKPRRIVRRPESPRSGTAVCRIRAVPRTETRATCRRPRRHVLRK